MSNVKDVVVPEGWETEEIWNILEYEQPDKYIVKSTEYKKWNKTPVLTANKAFILWYTNENFWIYNQWDVIIFDDFTMDLKYVNFNFKVKSSAIKFLKNNSNYNLYYIYSLLKNLNLSPDSHKRSYISEVQPLKVSLPQSLQEQEKIAKILSTVDATIEKTDSLIEKYKKIKTWFMEDLFTKGIDVNTWKPHTKFKDSELGRIPEGWEVKKMNKINNQMTNWFVWVASPFYVENWWVNYLFWNNVRKNKIETHNVLKISNEFNNTHIKSQLKYWDMLTVQSWHIGTSAIVPINFPTSNCHALIITRFKKDIINPFYVSYYCNSKLWMNRMENIFVGSTIKHINVKDFQDFLIPLPNKIEQDKIAEILTEADNKIEKEQAYKEKLEKIKKWLMNDLLTGKVRVKY